MLSDQDHQLLSAFLDGAVSGRQRKAVLRLLHRSSEARALFLRLQQDGERLRALPPQRLSPDFPVHVLRVIAEHGLHPTPPVRPPVPVRGVSAWVPLAAAAGLLLAVTAASYLYFAYLRAEPDQGPVAVIPQPEPEPVPPPEWPAPVPPPPVDPGLKVALSQLSDAAKKSELVKELQKETSYHLNLPTRNSAKAVERLTHVLKTKNIKVVVDRQARTSLQKKQTTRYLLYAENLRPDELTDILHALGTDLQKGPKNAALDGMFENVVLRSLTPDHRQEMAALLVLAPEKLQAPRRLRPGEVLPEDLFKDNIIAVPNGSKTTAKGRANPPPERYALVLASHVEGMGPAGMSPEIRRFLQQRKAQRPGTLQVILELQELTA